MVRKSLISCLETINSINKIKNDLNIYGAGKESVSTKNTSLINQTTEISIEAKPLSHRKTIENRQEPCEMNLHEKSLNSVKISAERISCVSPKRIFNETFQRKPKVSDLIFWEDRKNMIANQFNIAKETLNNTHTAVNTTNLHLPSNFKRIPAMLDRTSKKEFNIF